jgi:threonine dehydrogenase-like Zn-dependent dehydrogenase
MATARAFWTIAPGRGEIREEVLAPPGPADVVVRAAYSGVSRGTEALVFSGHVPPTEYARMRAPFQTGEFPGPVKYGYVSVGDVEEGPAALVGRRVFVLYPHQTRYVVPASAASVIPDEVPSARAILASNLETAINGLWDARPHVGDRITVVGAGTVGCLVAWLAGRMPGCRVELVDVNPSRARVAAALGVGFAEPSAAAPDADLVVHASGSPDGRALALRIAGFESTILEMSWYGDRAVTLPLGEAFHVRRLTIVSSQVSVVASSQRARWDNRRRMDLALSLLADPALDVLITGESAFADLPATMARLAGAPGETICHRIRYDR